MRTHMQLELKMECFVFTINAIFSTLKYRTHYVVKFLIKG
jgi:hypothetical protein